MDLYILVFALKMVNTFFILVNNVENAVDGDEINVFEFYMRYIC